MAAEHGHTHAGAGDREVGQTEDLARLVAQLLLLVRLVRAVVDDRAGHRENVVGDVGDVLVRRAEVDGLTVEGELLEVGLRALADLLGQLAHTRDTGAGDGLVGRDDEALEAGGVGQRLEHGHRGHRRAVRVGDDALRSACDGVRVHLGDDERHVGVHAPRGGVVDDDDARLREPGREPPGRRATGGEDRDVEPGGVGGVGILDEDVAAERAHAAARGALGGEQAQLGDLESRVLEQAQHDAADLSRGADDAEPDGPRGAGISPELADHRPVPACTTASSSASSSNAVWTTRTASSS